MADDGWRMTDGGWLMTDGGWWMAEYHSQQIRIGTVLLSAAKDLDGPVAQHREILRRAQEDKTGHFRHLHPDLLGAVLMADGEDVVFPTTYNGADLGLARIPD